MSGLRVVPQQLSSVEARERTDQIKTKAESLWRDLLALYESGAHLALGYDSWSEYCKAEFGSTKARSYKLLDAGRVIRAIEAESTTVDSTPSERAARELARVQRAQGDAKAAQVWDEAVDEYGPEPTAAQVRSVADKHMEPPTTESMTKQQQQLGRALQTMADSAEVLAVVLAEKDALDGVGITTLSHWDELISFTRSKLSHLYRRMAHERSA